MKRTNWIILIVAILLIIIIAIALNWKAIKRALKEKGDTPGGLFSTETGTGDEDDIAVVNTGLIGKKVYAKVNDTKIRSSAEKNDGWINNIICKLAKDYEPAPVIEGVVKDKTGDSYNWYYVKLGVPQLCMNYKHGYIREDVVTIK